MKTGFFVTLALVVWVCAEMPASGQSTRVAVAGDASLANLVDVISTQLSQSPGLVLLDRADLDKLGQEQQLQATLASKDFTAINLIPADGLVLLRAVSQNGKKGVFARLVVVQPGVVLREVALPDGADPVAQAAALEKDFAPYWPKLALVRRGRIEAFSLLGLRFEVDAPETRELERSVNLLLASRLSAEAGVLVLERWRLNDAAFEKYLAPREPSSFWTGSSLIDGSMQMRNGVITMTLRLRTAKSAEVTFTDQDTPEHLPDLVDRLADRIQRQPARGVSWKPSAEAKHFAELGRWCLDNGLFDDGTEAIESALALGDASRTTHMLQVEAYALEAYPDDLRELHYQISASEESINEVIASESVSARVSAAIQGVQLVRDYMKANRDFTSQMRIDYMSANPGFTSFELTAEKNVFDPRKFGVNRWLILEDPKDLSLVVLDICLKTLDAAYLNGFQANHPREMADLRHETQQLIGQMGDRLLADPPSLPREAYLCLRAGYAGLWHETPEETIAFYREMLKGEKVDGIWIRNAIFNEAREPYLDRVEPSEHMNFEKTAPWISAWDGRSPEDVQTIWKNFLTELASSSDPVLQNDALKFDFGSCVSEKGCDEVLGRFVSFLQTHSDSLSGPRGDEFAAGNYCFLWWAATSSQQSHRNRCYHDILDVYDSLFDRQVALPAAWIFDLIRFAHYQDSAETIPNLYAALTGYRRWYQAQASQDAEVGQALEIAQNALRSEHPQLEATELKSNPLSVTRYWGVTQSEPKPGQSWRGPIVASFSPDSFEIRENKVWFVNADLPHQVLCVDPVKLQVTASYPIPPEFDTVDISPNNRLIPRYLEVTPEWLVVGMNGQVLLGSRSDNRWRALNVPPSHYQPRWIDERLYLLYNKEAGIKNELFTVLRTKELDDAAGSGLILVSLPDGTCENLISSRRIPPQNALDGQPLGSPRDLWLTSAGLNLAFSGRPIYASPLGKNDWSPVKTAPSVTRLKITSAGALIQDGFGDSGHFGELKLLAHDGDEVLLSDENDTEKALWRLPKDVKTRGPVSACPIMRGDNLCLYSAGNSCLYYFTKGQKEGQKIPLIFTALVPTSQETGGTPVPVLGYGGLQSTDYGLIIPQMDEGFWVVPWTDIDAYLPRSR